MNTFRFNRLEKWLLLVFLLLLCPIFITQSHAQVPLKSSKKTDTYERFELGLSEEVLTLWEERIRFVESHHKHRMDGGTDSNWINQIDDTSINLSHLIQESKHGGRYLRLTALPKNERVIVELGPLKPINPDFIVTGRAISSGCGEIQHVVSDKGLIRLLSAQCERLFGQYSGSDLGQYFRGNCLIYSHGEKDTCPFAVDITFVSGMEETDIGLTSFEEYHLQVMDSNHDILTIGEKFHFNGHVFYVLEGPYGQFNLNYEPDYSF